MNLNDEMQGASQDQPQRLQQPQPAQQGQPEQQGQQQQMSPEAQEQFDIFVANGMSVIHSQQVTDSILNKVAKDKNKLVAFANVLVDVVSKLVDSAISNNVMLTNDTLIQGANVLLQEILSVAYAAGMQQLNEEQKTEIIQRAVSMYLDQSVKTGRMTQEQLVSMGKEAQQSPEGQAVMQTAQQYGGF